MAAKVVDGLFVGDALSSMDVNFLVANKITRVINCAALELENRWEALGIEYLSFEWVAEENFDLLAADGMTQAWGQDANEFEVEGCPCVWLGKTCAFIEEALEVGAGVLVHSQDGTNRACSCVLAYLMNVYGWSLHKSMSFLQRKRSDLLPSQKFVKQLQQVSDWLETTYLDAMPHAADWAARKFRSWNVADIDLHMISTRANEELLLHNTYLNSGASEPQPHAVWAKAGHDAGNLRPNESSNTTEMPLLSDQQKTLAPVTVSSPHRAKRRSRREAGLACREPKSVSWIDADEIVKRGQPVMRSPFSKRVVPERPPGPSYRSLAATGQWKELESSPAADSRRSPSKAAVPSLSPARTVPSPVNFATIVYEEGEVTREEEEEEEEGSGLRLKPRATRPIPETPGMAESLSTGPEASSMAESLLSVREDHANPADEGHFENTANRSGASTNFPLMLDNLNLGHLRSALLAKGVVESGSVHAHRPPSPPVSPPRRRNKSASKPAQRPSTSLTRPTSASASRSREVTRTASKSTAKSKRLSSSTKSVRSSKSGSSQKMNPGVPTSSRRRRLGTENVEPPPTLSKSCPPRRPARVARNRGKARAISQDDHHNLTTTLAVDVAQSKVSSRR